MYLIQIKHAQIKIPLCSFGTVWAEMQFKFFVCVTTYEH